MKDEIKEILFLLHNDRLTDSGKRKLEDYITNLQTIEQEHQRINGELREENKRLRETNKIFSERIISESNPDYIASFKDFSGDKEWLKKLYSSL